MLSGIKLLLVEDDEDDYLITRDLLEEIQPGQIHLDWVTSVDAALQSLLAKEHDLCLVDYRLGAQDGLQLLQSAHQSNIHTPFIMLTGQDNSEIDVEAQKAGAVDYLVKSELSAAMLGRAIRYARARRDAEDERVQRLRAESENRSKSEFLAHLSHELRTPLTSILGYTGLMINDEQDLQKLQNLRTIERNGRHLLCLLNDVLDLSKIEAGRLDLDFRPVRLESCLADLQSLLEVKAREKGVRLTFSAAQELPVTIHTDPTRLHQILANLLGNAIKFTHVGDVALEITLVPAGDTAEAVQFKVKDTGIGISKSDLRKIFEPFTQAGNGAQSTSELGFGLGLAISLQLARKLGGSIECESELGAGSTFTLTLDPGDLSAVSRRPLALTNSPEQPRDKPLTSLRGRVLVADDLPDIRVLLSSLLREAGAEVVCVENGEQAISEILASEGSDNSIDAVVMDLQMPVVDGFSALKTLRSEDYRGPVIALTASAMRGERERCLEAGFTEYLGKPIDLANLLATLAYHLPATDDAAANSVNATDAHSKGTILLVEDNADARRATAKLISHLGWHVVSAADGTEALSLVSRLEAEASSGAVDFPITLALIDLGLPDIDGYDLAQKLRAGALRNSSLIALSGAVSDPERSSTAGFTGHIMKPILLPELARLLQQQS